ncbi:NADH-quinone oxidoreductase subunit L [Tistrella mobilis]|uniref:NADH dehydrogenase subunit L n=1 Tax=Tistrella mobilis (strain KA081020-065) TaxID=1110502 RepID=I3TM17_TISMK|nr:NADH-quinone oxidoreductase subunit L [Tistrella mobilis]AFK53805.1 NADH dehydrogenase subunit L [Tistrella mobilis KA081020-065]MAM76818.1 NADH-quinone oxidoreductase subunit L [Tistrella sp.]
MYVALILLPLAAAIVAGFFGRVIGDRGSQLVTTGAVGLAALLSVVAFFDVAVGGNATTVNLFTWIRSGELAFSWALRIDSLTAVMLIVVNGVSFMVHIYSIGYMSHDPHKPRFMAYLSLFTFAMLTLVTADNLVQMFFGWEGVGLASYLLIGFWYKRPSANKAAMKAFVVNRVGDFGFSLGIFALFFVTGSVGFDAIFADLGTVAGTSIDFLGMTLPTIEVIAVLLFIGAMGKSAQLGLHTWLPDAMEGPTPVSALIHAATMVTAGVFMVARLSPVFELTSFTSDMITVIGASTAFFAATVGLTQTDIKRVIAYSTCSQLGYMFFAAGVGAYPAAIFHLMTHAFFKALLFLGAGSVIHAMSDEQDMRKMGGIWKLIPVTYTFMWIGSLALAGLPPFAGFFSKDMILETAYAAHTGVGAYAFWLGIAAAFMTAFYSWRLLFMTFHGKPRADKHTMDHVHESPLVMTAPLFPLAVGAIVAGYIGLPMVDPELHFWNGAITMLGEHNILEEAHHVPGWVKLLPLVMSVGGIALAWFLYIRRPDLPGKIARDFSGLHKFLLNKWYFDELYDAIFVRPSLWIGRVLWQAGDRKIIDGLGPDGIAAVSVDLARRAGRMQSGYVYHYAFAMLIGLALIVSYFFFGLEAGW